MIDVVGVLIVPRAPRRAAIQRYDRALIVAEENALRIGGVDPHLLRVVATRRAFETRERAAAVGRFVARRMQRVHDVGIPCVEIDAAIVAALAVTNSYIVGGELRPAAAAVIGAVEAKV